MSSDKPKKKFSDVFPTPESFRDSILKYLDENPQENLPSKIWNDPEIQKKLKIVHKKLEDSGINEQLKELAELREKAQQDNPK